MRVACRQCAWRAFCRWATYAGGGRADLPDGCDESCDLSFYQEILSWRRENDAHCQRVLEAARAEGATVRLITTAAEQRRVCGRPEALVPGPWMRGSLAAHGAGVFQPRAGGSRAQDGFSPDERARTEGRLLSFAPVLLQGC